MKKEYWNWVLLLLPYLSQIINAQVTELRNFDEVKYLIKSM
jgi:hypothetical protein